MAIIDKTARQNDSNKVKKKKLFGVEKEKMSGKGATESDFLSTLRDSTLDSDVG